MTHVWLAQFWNGTEWRNSLHDNFQGWDTVFIVHRTKAKANAALRKAKKNRPVLLKKTRVVKLELPS